MKSSKEITKGIVNAFGIIILGCGILYLLYLIKSVFIYLLLAAILTLMGTPLRNFFTDRCRCSKTLAVSLVLVVYGLVLLVFIGMFVPLFSTQLEHVSGNDFQKIQLSIHEYQEKVHQSLSTVGIEADFLRSRKFASVLTEEKLSAFINSFFGFLGQFVIGLGATFFMTFFLLRDKTVFQYQIRKYIIPEAHTDKFMTAFDMIERLLSRYFFGLGIQLLIFFAACYIVLLIFGTKTAIVIALISALLNIVPYIGPLIANMLATLFTLMSYIDQDFMTVALPHALYVSLAYIVIQFLDNNFLQPYIFSNSVKSHPLEIFLVILISGLLTGVFGMIIAVPLYTSVKVILREFFPGNRLVQLLTKNLDVDGAEKNRPSP